MKKEKKTVPLSDLQALKKELEGFTIGNFVYTGLLAKIKSSLNRYYLNSLYDSINSELAAYEKFRESEILEKGEEKDGAWFIFPEMKDGEPNPVFQELLKASEKILSEEVEISFPVFTPEELFDFEGAENYGAVYRLLVE